MSQNIDDFKMEFFTQIKNIVLKHLIAHHLSLLVPSNEILFVEVIQVSLMPLLSNRMKSGLENYHLSSEIIVKVI
jgi:hypothetical protein